MSDAQGWQQKWGQVVAQAWSDDSYKQRLLADPAAVLAEQGLTAPTGKQVRIVEDTADTVHVVLPAKPDELSDDELDQAAGGAYIAVLLPSTPVGKAGGVGRGRSPTPGPAGCDAHPANLGGDRLKPRSGWRQSQIRDHRHPDGADVTRPVFT